MLITSQGINHYYLYYLNSNSITIKIKGSGLQTVSNSYIIPDEIYLNDGNQIASNTNQVTLTEETSTLILKFNDNQISGAGLFSDLTNILEIDLSNCAFTDMASMFKGCTSLTSINFSGVDSSSVHDFYSLFLNCESLISVDLSELNILGVTDFRDMFTGCNNLKYINLVNYDESTLSGDYYSIQIDEAIAKNLVICLNEEKAPTLYNSVNSGLCHVFYCGENWKQQSLNYNEESNSCVENNYIGEDTTELINGDEGENSVTNINTNIFSQKIENNDNILKKFFIDNTDNASMGKEIVDDIIDSIKAGDFKQFMEETNETQLIKKSDDKTYQVSTLSSQMNNEDIISINFGDCEEKLKNSSNINNNEELIIFKIVHEVPESKTQVVEYTLFTMSGKQLNLDICKDSSILYNIPVDIEEKDIYKYNPKSDFYNDVCFQYTSESGTDMSNYDRKNEFNEKNMALCEKNCEFKEYNKEDKKVVCDCKVKNVFNTLDNIDKKDLLEKFSNYKNIFNLEVFNCFKLLFSKKGLITNIGSYVIFSIIFIYLINLFLFVFKGYHLFYKGINKILEQNINNKNNNDLINSKKNNNESKRDKVKSKTEVKKKKNDLISFPPNKRNNKKKISKKSKTKRRKKHKSQHLSEAKDIFTSKNEIKLEVQKINEKKENRNDYEMNSLSYEEAQKSDDRTYCEYYLSLIRTKQLFVFTFYTKSDYNSRLIKIIFFFTSFSLYYTIKALFFNDSVLHVIYENSGAYDFIYQLPQILYSTIISTLLGVILSKLSLTQVNVLEIKNSDKDRDSREYKNEFNNFIKKIKIKFILFFVINFLLLILFWYYLSCFCAVYKNTQVYLIKDVLISFGMSLIYPFFINLLPGIFRIYSLKDKNKNHTCMYYTSKVLQFI